MVSHVRIDYLGAYRGMRQDASQIAAEIGALLSSIETFQEKYRYWLDSPLNERQETPYEQIQGEMESLQRSRQVFDSLAERLRRASEMFQAVDGKLFS